MPASAATTSGPTGSDHGGFELAATELASTSRWLYAKGWAPATAGNFSRRVAHDRIAITTSGRDKELLDASQIMLVDLDGKPLSPGKPSAETLLHTRLYRRLAGAGAVLHTHSVNATVLSRQFGGGATIRFAGYELAKAFTGITDHHAELDIPVVANSQDMVALADAAERALDAAPGARAYLIEGHGTYIWGDDLATTRRQLEALEFLFACELTARRSP